MNDDLNVGPLGTEYEMLSRKGHFDRMISDCPYMPTMAEKG